jgi:hypothetical protein
MLIPAFAMLGNGIAQIIKLKEYSEPKFSIDPDENKKHLSSRQQQTLPPKQTEFVSNIPDIKYQTGDLVPPSIVENTTRHLEIDKEGKTINLPKDK